MVHRNTVGAVWHLTVVLVTVGATVVAASAQTFTYSGSAGYSSGEYIFADRTHSAYLSTGLTANAGRVSVFVTVPVIVQSSPWVSYSLIGGIPSGGPQQEAVGQRRGGGGSGGGGPGGGASGGPGKGGSVPGDPEALRRSADAIALPDTASYTSIGVGDPSARLEVDLLSSAQGGTGLRLTASAKAPLADVDRGFGTGAWDAGLGMALSQRLGRWLGFVDVMYWWMGDLAEVRLNSTVAYGASLGRFVAGGRLGLLASISGYVPEIIDGVDPPLQVSVGASYVFGSGQYGLAGSIGAGLTESAPGISLGLGWQVRL